MKTLEKDELYQNLQGFLKSKGVELKDGSYANKIQKSCALLSEAINIGQKGLVEAKGQLDRKLDQLRQVVHEKTAGKAPPPPPASATATPPKPPVKPKTKARPRTKSRKSRTKL